MKTKFLCYSRSNPNQVVWHYAELEKVGEGVYTYLQQKDQYREEDDMIAIVLQLEDVFFEYGTYNRRFLADKDVVATGAEVLKNFHRTIEQTMQEGRHLQLLLVRIYEELGLDAAPLIRYREERRLRLQREDEERKRRKEEQRRQAEEQRHERLRQAGNRFLAGESISSVDLSACANLNRFPYRFAHMDPVPKRNRTLPKQYPSQAHERQSQSKTRRMLRCGRSPVRKTLRNNGCKY